MRICEEHRLGGCGVSDEECVGCHIEELRKRLLRAHDALKAFTGGYARAEIDACAERPCNGSPLSLAAHALRERVNASPTKAE